MTGAVIAFVLLCGCLVVDVPAIVPWLLAFISLGLVVVRKP